MVELSDDIVTMLKKSPHIKSILRQNAALNEIVAQSNFLANIDKQVREHITAPLREHCKVANYRENILYLHVDSPAWATRLRFAIPSLLVVLQNTRNLRQLTEIQIHLSAATPEAKTELKTPTTKIRLSKDTAEQLNCLAEHVTDQKLAAALLRLAKHGN